MNLKHCISAACLTVCTFSASAEPWMPADWELAFYDDFSASSLDATKWGRIDYEEGWSPGETTWLYHQSQDESLVNMNDEVPGHLKLKAGYGDYDNQAKFQGSVAEDADTYACGGIDTKNTFTFKYGYVEVRASFTHQLGLWPAIWMMPKDGGEWPSGGEIDIMEHLGNEMDARQTVHYTDAGGGHLSQETKTPIADSWGGTDMHVYGMRWMADEIAFYVDGVNTAIIEKDKINGVWPFGEDGKDFYLIMDQQLTTVSSWQTGNKAVNEASLRQAIADNQAYMLIDYVKVYSADYTYYNIPEPATATLSLLALAGLAARRRRE